MSRERNRPILLDLKSTKKAVDGKRCSPGDEALVRVLGLASASKRKETAKNDQDNLRRRPVPSLPWLTLGGSSLVYSSIADDRW